MRTEKALKNVITSMVTYGFLLVLGIFIRRFLLYSFDTELVAYDSLMSNIFSLISIANFGADDLFTYRLYQAFAHGDRDRIQKLLGMYRTMFHTLGFAVLAICCVLFLLLPVLFAGKVTHWGYFRLMFLLYTLSAVSSYYFAYWRVLLVAGQIEHKAIRIETGVQTFSMLAKAVVLWTTRNYLFYLLLVTGGSLLSLLLVARRSRREFADITPRKAAYGELKQEGILTEIRQTLAVKIANTINLSTDSLLITGLVNVGAVALYGNYLLIGSHVQTLLTRLIAPLNASIADLLYKESKEDSWRFYRTMDLCCWFLASVVFVGFATVFQRAITIFFGAQFLLPQSFVVAYALQVYISAKGEAAASLRNSFGEFGIEQRYSLGGMVINLSASLLLGKLWGITGIVIGTILANLFLWNSRLVIVDRKFFGRSVAAAWRREALYALLLCVELAASLCLTTRMPQTVPGMLLCCVWAIIVPTCINILIFFRTSAFRDIVARARSILLRRRNSHED